MNRELAAMNRISNTVQNAIKELDAGERERVLHWFMSWTAAQTDHIVVGGDSDAPGNGRPLASVPDADPVQS
jgi:hypothetical protein